MASTRRLTVGGRYEWWRGFDGYNVNGGTKVMQPTVSSSKFSPKATFVWDPIEDWSVTASLAKAYRFATPAELYQLVTTGATFYVIWRDERRLPPAQAVFAWPAASRLSAVVAFSPFCLPIHFWRTRRSFFGVLVGLFYVAVVLALNFLSSMGIGWLWSH